MQGSGGAEKPDPPPSSDPSDSTVEPGPPLKVEAPVATNSWARRTILLRAQEIGLPPELAKQVGSVASWYYNRLVVLINKKDAVSQELPYNTNRYLVPISLALAAGYKKLPVDLERFLRLSGTPSRRTIATAHALLAEYNRMLAPAKKATGPKAEAPNSSIQRSGVRPKPITRVANPSGPSAAGTPPPTPPPKSLPSRPVPTGDAVLPKSGLAIPASDEILELRNLFSDPKPPADATKAAAKPKQQNTNTWARKRIVDLSRSLGLPERVRNRALGFYERIVDLHSAKGGAPPGKRLQLSPRLNWSLVYTTIYLGCRSEEYPMDLREILGRNPHRGSLREMYGLYRFYKRELGLTIKLVDVRTFILSWFDGFEMSELLHEKATAEENERIKKRAIAIANRARGAKSLENTSTRIIAAGALTTALAESNPPGNRHAFYMAVAAFLHMGEATIRFIVSRIAEIK